MVLQKIEWFKIKMVKVFLAGITGLYSCYSNAQVLGNGTGDYPNISNFKQLVEKYSEIMTPDTETQKGLFTVHLIGGDHYFELPKTILGKNILVVSRISSTPYKFSSHGAGAYTRNEPHQVIRFQQSGSDIILRLAQHSEVVHQFGPLSEAVRQNNFEPIIYKFKIEAVNPNTASPIIKVNGFFTGHVPLMGIKDSNFGLSGVDPSRSMISMVRVFDRNVEVRHVLTYNASKLSPGDRNGSLSFEMNQSFVLLPEKPMSPRLYDYRVGYFTTNKVVYGTESGVPDHRRYILRWRLEPKNRDRYYRGQLVEPVKPIVFYLDPATPKKWWPFIKKGVEDWQESFERIGFKNAIMVKNPPSPIENKNWDINDFQNSVIRFVPTESKGAFGGNVHDPRTGEILKADISLLSNNLRRHRNYFIVQTAASNPEAQKIKLEDNVMGRLLQSVVAHEVGHALGLSHSFAASRAYPIDSLRSKSFTSSHGNSASIMDYAWSNYVAQPEDGVQDFYNRIGEYDHFMIKYGYQPVDSVANGDKERKQLAKWIKEQANNPYVRFPRGITGFNDIGDDPIRASALGLANLKTVLPKLTEWIRNDEEEYLLLRELYEEVFDQFERYMDPVAKLVGGSYYMPKSPDEIGPVHEYISAERQRNAVKFLHSYLFQTQDWLIDRSILERIPGGLTGKYTLIRYGEIQQQVLGRLLYEVLPIFQDIALNGKQSYSTLSLYGDLIDGIFSELRNSEPIDVFRRNLQKSLVEKLAVKLDMDEGIYKNTDVESIALGELIRLRKDIKKSISRQKDKISKYHLQDLMARIDAIIEKPN